MYPIAVAGDLFGIYNELKSVHLRNLNVTRAQSLFTSCLLTGQVSHELAHPLDLLWQRQPLPVVAIVLGVALLLCALLVPQR